VTKCIYNISVGAAVEGLKALRYQIVFRHAPNKSHN